MTEPTTTQPDDTRVLEDGSTHTIQALLDTGEACRMHACRAAREAAELEKARYQTRSQVDAAYDELNDLITDGAITADAADSLRNMLRDALGLNP